MKKSSCKGSTLFVCYASHEASREQQSAKDAFPYANVTMEKVQMALFQRARCVQSVAYARLCK